MRHFLGDVDWIHPGLSFRSKVGLFAVAPDRVDFFFASQLAPLSGRRPQLVDHGLPYLVLVHIQQFL